MTDQKIDKIHKSVVFALLKLLEAKYRKSAQHVVRTSKYCRIISEELQQTGKYISMINQNFIDTIYLASRLHDLGKVAIPDEILKKPGKLTRKEFAMVRKHTLTGGNILRKIDKKYPGNHYIHMGIELAECHHEKWDGSGYPKELKAEVIPLSARILTLADIYDALTSQRCYKKKFSHEHAHDYIISEKGKYFDPEIVEAFLRKQNVLEKLKR